MSAIEIDWYVWLSIVAAIGYAGWAIVASSRVTLSPEEQARDDDDQSESMRALLDAANNEVSSRPRVRAGTALPTTTTKGTK